MIVVLADDLTGAAELGGLALRYRLNVEITTKLYPPSGADLLIIATNTRSLPEAEARSVIASIGDELLKRKPRRLFVKIDSVLRGHVLTEINTLKKRLGLKRALLVPANPSLGRTIADGTYFLNGRPVHLSSFSEDPEFPVHTSSVAGMLGAGEGEVQVLKSNDEMPEEGIVVGEVEERSDLEAWGRRLDADTLAAGAAEFFDVVLALENNLPHPRQPAGQHAEPGSAFPQPEQRPALMIAGSSFQKKKDIKAGSFAISYITPVQMQHQAAAESWIAEVTANLERYGRAVIAIDPDISREGIQAVAIRSFVATMAARIADRTAIKELLVEGGATAESVLRELGMDTLYPSAELAPGVIRMRVKEAADRLVTLKPGSYEWPSFIFSEEAPEKERTAGC